MTLQIFPAQGYFMIGYYDISNSSKITLGGKNLKGQNLGESSLANGIEKFRGIFRQVFSYFMVLINIGMKKFGKSSTICKIRLRQIFSAHGIKMIGMRWYKFLRYILFHYMSWHEQVLVLWHFLQLHKLAIFAKKFKHYIIYSNNAQNDLHFCLATCNIMNKSHDIKNSTAIRPDYSSISNIILATYLVSNEQLTIWYK